MLNNKHIYYLGSLFLKRENTGQWTTGSTAFHALPTLVKIFHHSGLLQSIIQIKNKGSRTLKKQRSCFHINVPVNEKIKKIKLFVSWHFKRHLYVP